MARIFHSLTVFLSVLIISVTAQTPEKTYPPEGIYATFSAFRNGKPDLVRSQLVKFVSQDEYTLRQWVNSEKLLYLDQNQQKQSYNSANFWGFFEKGVLYIYLGNKFHKVHTLGQISYFLESYPVIKGNMAPVVTEARSTSAYRFFDMETGDILDYTAENLLDLLEPDEAIYLEYKSIVSLKERKKKMFIFMEKYNHSHPLEWQAL